MSLKFCIIIESNSQKYFFCYCSVHQHGRRDVKWKPRILAFESYQKNFQKISLLNDNLIPRPAIKCCDWNFWNLPSFISMSWLHLFRRFARGQVLDPPRPMAIGNACNLLCLIDFRQIITHGLKSSHPGNTSNSLIHEPECQWPRRLKKKRKNNKRVILSQKLMQLWVYTRRGYDSRKTKNTWLKKREVRRMGIAFQCNSFLSAHVGTTLGKWKYSNKEQITKYH